VFFQPYLYIKCMKRGVKQMFSLAGVLLLASGAFASNPGDSKAGPAPSKDKWGAATTKKVSDPDDETNAAPDSVPAVETEKPANDSPYAAIVERNIFALVPIPPPPVADDNEKSNTPPVNVTLTGITTIFGNTRAYFLVQDPPQAGKPPAAAESVMLTVGERRGMLEALDIDVKAGTVKIKNDGVISTITFPKVTQTAGAGAPPPPGSPPGFNPGGGRRGGFAPGGAPGAATGVPPRPMRSPGGGPGITQNPNNFQNSYAGGGAPAYGQSGGLYGSAGGGAPAYTANLGGVTAPLNSIGNPQSPVNNTPPAQQLPALTPDEQTVMIEAQRAYARQQNDPVAIILPPTEISEAEGEAGGPPGLPGGPPVPK